MQSPKALVWLAISIAAAACGSVSAPSAYAPSTPPPSVTASAVATVAPTSPASAEPTPPSGTPSALPSPLHVPAPSLVCPNQYQAGHRLVVAVPYSQGEYGSLEALDVTDPFVPRLVCTLNNSPYPLQRVQWRSASDFLLLLTGSPNELADVNVASASVTTIRQLNSSVYLAALSPDRAWMATMESGAGDTRVARLYGPAGVQTLATYPPAAGHGGTIYGFGGPTVEFSTDGSMLLTVDYEANNNDATVSDLQVFDLNGTRLSSAARGLWAVWDNDSLYYYDGGDHKVYKWVRGSAPVAVLQSGWLEPSVSPDGQGIAYLVDVDGRTFTLNVVDTKSGVATAIRASGQRIDPLFVNGAVIWASELVACDCFGGNNPTGKVFAYDSATGSEREVALPDLLAPLAGASLSSGP